MTICTVRNILSVNIGNASCHVNMQRSSTAIKNVVQNVNRRRIYASVNWVSIGSDNGLSPMLGYCQLDPWEKISMKFKSKYQTFHSWKCIWKYRLRNGGHFVHLSLSCGNIVFLCTLNTAWQLKCWYFSANVSWLNLRKGHILSEVSISIYLFVWLLTEPHIVPWWCHQMETFSALLAICEGNSPVTGEFHAQRPLTRSFDVFFDLHLNEWLSKQSRGWWFETPSRPLWRHSYALSFRSALSFFALVLFIIIWL